MTRHGELVIAGLAATLSTTAFAQTSGDVAAGQGLATRVCAQCHKVAPNQPPTPRSAAPDFAAIAKMPSTTEMSLHAFLSSPHPTMPNLILTPRQQDDIIAFILSLRASP
jgi:cytochrome c2